MIEKPRCPKCQFPRPAEAATCPSCGHRFSPARVPGGERRPVLPGTDTLCRVAGFGLVLAPIALPMRASYANLALAGPSLVTLALVASLPSAIALGLCAAALWRLHGNREPIAATVPVAILAGSLVALFASSLAFFGLGLVAWSWTRRSVAAAETWSRLLFGSAVAQLAPLLIGIFSFVSPFFAFRVPGALLTLAACASMGVLAAFFLTVRPQAGAARRLPTPLAATGAAVLAASGLGLAFLGDEMHLSSLANLLSVSAAMAPTAMAQALAYLFAAVAGVGALLLVVATVRAPSWRTFRVAALLGVVLAVVTAFGWIASSAVALGRLTHP